MEDNTPLTVGWLRGPPLYMTQDEEDTLKRFNENRVDTLGALYLASSGIDQRPNYEGSGIVNRVFPGAVGMRRKLMEWYVEKVREQELRKIGRALAVHAGFKA